MYKKEGVFIFKKFESEFFFKFIMYYRFYKL